jgi:hypothetical protein
MQVADYQVDERTVTTEGDDPLVFTYRPSRMTPEYAQRYHDLVGKNGEEMHKAFVFIIGSLVTDWNLTGPVVLETIKTDRLGKQIINKHGIATYETKEIVPAGQKVPIDGDVLSKMRTRTLAKIVQALFEDANSEDFAVDPPTGSESN